MSAPPPRARRRGAWRRRRGWPALGAGARRLRTGARRLREEDAGVVAGWEALPFGFLVFVVGALVAANAWAVVDAKMAVTAAARQGARAFVEAADAASARPAAVQAAGAALAAHGRQPAGEVAVAGSFRRCATVTVTVGHTVPAIVLPWVGGFGDGVTTRASHAEVVDPLRSGVEGEAGSGGEVVCDGR